VLGIYSIDLFDEKRSISDLHRMHGGYAATCLCENQNPSYIGLTKRRCRNDIRRRREMVSPAITGNTLGARCPPTPGAIFLRARSR